MKCPTCGAGDDSTLVLFRGGGMSVAVVDHPDGGKVCLICKTRFEGETV